MYSMKLLEVLWLAIVWHSAEQPRTARPFSIQYLQHEDHLLKFMCGVAVSSMAEHGTVRHSRPPHDTGQPGHHLQLTWLADVQHGTGIAHRHTESAA